MTLILRATARFLLPMLLLFSVFVFWRGHNEPGGGFVGGLLAAAAFAVYSIAYGAEETRKVLHIDTRTLIGLGLLIAALSGALAMLRNLPFFTGIWWTLFEGFYLGTPVFFDLGVYLAVMGVTLTIIFAMEEEEDKAL